MGFSIAYARAKKRYEAYKQQEDATTAVEFAMVAGPFFFLLFGLIEICLIFVVATVMEHGAEEAARSIRTGGFDGSVGTAQQDLIDDICTGMVQLFDCTNKLKIQVDAPTDFASAPALDVMKPDGTFKDQTDMNFDTGAGDSVVVVRVLFEWSLITPVISRPLSNYGSSSRLIQATVAFRNEPF